MGIEKEMTGVDYIGKFNPDGRDDVEIIKQSAVRFINEIIKYSPSGRRRAIAITHVEEAAMMAVKSLFEG